MGVVNVLWVWYGMEHGIAFEARFRVVTVTLRLHEIAEYLLRVAVLVVMLCVEDGVQSPCSVLVPGS